MKMNCINAKNPDQNGVYRNSNTTQAKHHWWWKMNMVFDQLRVVRNYTGTLPIFNYYLSIIIILYLSVLIIQVVMYFVW